MDFNTIVSVLLVIWQSAVPTVAVHSGLPLSPASGSVPPPAGVGRASGSLWRRPRVKRCSCSSLMDKECVYFCHLDIIWINTPEQTVPYGLGNTRSRRALQDKDPLGPMTRCWCTNGKDNTCWNFCQTGAELRAQSALKKGDGSRATTEEDCLGPGPKCVQGRAAHGRRMNRFETIDKSIQMAFRISKLKASLKKMDVKKLNRTHKKRSIWECLKKTT